MLTKDQAAARAYAYLLENELYDAETLEWVTDDELISFMQSEGQDPYADD
jgi:hypothetical protein